MKKRGIRSLITGQVRRLIEHYLVFHDATQYAFGDENTSTI